MLWRDSGAERQRILARQGERMAAVSGAKNDNSEVRSEVAERRRRRRVPAHLRPRQAPRATDTPERTVEHGKTEKEEEKQEPGESSSKAAAPATSTVNEESSLAGNVPNEAPMETEVQSVPLRQESYAQQMRARSRTKKEQGSKAKKSVDEAVAEILEKANLASAEGQQGANNTSWSYILASAEKIRMISILIFSFVVARWTSFAVDEAMQDASNEAVPTQFSQLLYESMEGGVHLPLSVVGCLFAIGSLNSILLLGPHSEGRPELLVFNFFRDVVSRRKAPDVFALLKAVRGVIEDLGLFLFGLVIALSLVF